MECVLKCVNGMQDSRYHTLPIVVIVNNVIKQQGIGVRQGYSITGPLSSMCGGLVASAAVWWLACWTANQEVQGSNPGQGRNLVLDFCSTCAL